MIDGYEYQKQKRREAKERKKPMDDADATIITTIVAFVILIVGLLVMAIVIGEDDRNNCEKVNGEYIIVDRTFAGKSAVDIYGCVRKAE